MIFVFLLIGLTTISLSAMELPVVPSSERRPIEESMFELHAQADRRLQTLEEKADSAQLLLTAERLDTAALAGIEKVKRVCGDVLLQNLVQDQNGKFSGFVRVQHALNAHSHDAIESLQAQLRDQAAQHTAQLHESMGDQKKDTQVIKTDIELLKAQLREQSRQQEQARGQLQEQVQQLNAVNVQLATELEAQKNATKKVYLVGGAVCLIAAGTALYLGARISQHDQDLYGCQSTQNKNESELNKNQSTLGRLFKSLYGTQNEIRSLSDQVAALQQRPYVSKDHNNALVYNAPNGSGPVRGAHVSKW